MKTTKFHMILMLSILASVVAQAVDSDADGMDDAYEQQIIDADANDDINSLADVLPDDDFDSDGRTNGQEEFDTSDPTDPGSTLGLIAYYPLDGNANDASANSHDGTVNGATLTEGVQGQGYSFDANDDLISIETNPDLDPSIISFGGYFYINGGTGDRQTLISKTEGASYAIHYDHNTYPGTICTYIKTSGSYKSTPIPLSGSFYNQWLHLFVTYNGQYIKIYMNGEEVASTTCTGSINPSNVPLYIGAEPNTPPVEPSSFFNGKADEVRLYNRGLPSNEVARLYAATRPTTEVTLEVASALGNPIPTIGTHTNEKNDEVTCSVSNVTTGTTQHECIGWTGTGSVSISGTSNVVEVILTEDSSITWNWQTNFWIDVTISGSGTLSHADGFYQANSDQNLIATPDSGWLFMGWGGDASGTNLSTDLTLSSPIAVTATFSDDADDDGLTNTEEVGLGTNPRNADSDGDKFPDKFEVDNGLPPNSNNTAVVNFIRNNGNDFDLYPSNAVLDVAIGQILIETDGVNATMQLQLEKSDDMESWTDAGDAVIWQIPIDGSKQFFRVRSQK